MKNKSKDKTTITASLIEQAYDSLILAIEAKQKNKLSKEIQLSINVCLLLGITMEGVINEISEAILDSWTYQELEKATTPLKWRIVSCLKEEGFKPSEEPLQTIIKLQKIRNEIAHPKSKKQERDVIIASSGTLTMSPSDDYVLPEENFEVYIGFGKLYEEYNAVNSLDLMRKSIYAVKRLKDLFASKNIFEWSSSYEKLLKGIKLK